MYRKGLIRAVCKCSGAICAIFVLANVLSACSLNHLAPGAKYQDQVISLLDPAAMKRRIWLTQKVSAIHGDRRDTFTALVEINPREVSIAGLNSLGLRFFLLNYMTGRDPSLKSEVLQGAQLPFPAEFVLRDVELAYWPVETVGQGLQSGYQIIETTDPKQRRTILHDEKPEIEITYSGSNALTSNVGFNNLRYGYRLEIEYLSLEEMN